MTSHEHLTANRTAAIAQAIFKSADERFAIEGLESPSGKNLLRLAHKIDEQARIEKALAVKLDTQGRI